MDGWMQSIATPFPCLSCIASHRIALYIHISGPILSPRCAPFHSIPPGYWMRTASTQFGVRVHSLSFSFAAVRDGSFRSVLFHSSRLDSSRLNPTELSRNQSTPRHCTPRHATAHITSRRDVMRRDTSTVRLCCYASHSFVILKNSPGVYSNRFCSLLTKTIRFA